jgi:two-component sensor histidine kinase
MIFSRFGPLMFWLCLTCTIGNGIAQQPKFLKLQPHKVQWANAVIKNALKTKDTLQLAEGYYLYGKIYEAAGDYLSAKRYYIKSLRIQEKRGDSFELSRLYLRLSGLGFTFFNYDDASRFAQLSLAVAQRIGSDKALLRAYSQMRGIHDTDWAQMPGLTSKNLPGPNYDSVLYYLKKLEPLARRSPDSVELAMINHYLGHELRRRNDPKAINYVEEKLKIFVKQKKPGDQVNALVDLADTYIQFGQPQRAKELLAKAERLHRTLPANDQDVQAIFEGTYTHYYQAIGDWEHAFEHQQKYHELERNRYLADREGAISRLSVDYETEKKELQLKSQKKELALNAENLKNQRRFLVTALVLLLLAVGASVAFYRLYRQNQHISRHNAELVREQNHRVKNNLQVVSSLLSLQSNRLTDDAAKQAVEESQSRIETMAILHRKLYDGEHLAGVNLSEFLQELTEHILYTFGYSDLQPDYEIEARELSADYALRLGLIVNELVTNACKYAFPDNDTPALRIVCAQKGNYLELTVADNGLGFSHSPKSMKTFGMRLIQIQVEQLYGTYEFKSVKGTSFWMKFKLV